MGAVRHPAARRPHICFFSGDITRSGGTERAGAAIANALAGTDRFRVSFLSMFEEHGAPFFAIDGRVGRDALYGGPVRGVWRYAATCARLRRAVLRRRVDVLVDIDGILDMYALAVKPLTGVRVVSWEHFNYLMHPDVPYRAITRRLAARAADAIVVLTEADRAMYERHGGLRCPVVVIPNPMSPADPEPVYDAGSRILLSAGRLSAQKGFDLLVDVAARVLPSRPQWRWVVLGEGEDRPMLERRIAQAGLSRQVLLPGRCDAAGMDRHYRGAALFVLTSRFEGLPMVLLEAKAHRVPIVAFDCPTGPRDIVRDGVDGRLSPPGDVEGMARALGALMDDPSTRLRYAARALDPDHTERYDEREIGRRWIDVLSRVMEGDR